MMKYLRYLFTFLAFAVMGSVALTIFKNNSIPKRGEVLKISCLTSPVQFIGNLTITWMHQTMTSICVADIHFCSRNSYNKDYNFTADNKGAYATIISLDRMKDNGTWTCSGSDNLGSNSTIINIYTTPNAVKVVHPILSDGDLGQDSINLICETDNCIYPAPRIVWFYLVNEQKVLYNVSDGIMVSNATPCDQLEAIYTSTLYLSPGTTFQGNIPFKTKFVCGVQHPALRGDIIYSESSSFVTFAVNLTSVTLKDMTDNDLPSIVELVQGYVVTLKCMTSTSRPTATVKWYIGNTNIINGIENVAKPGDNGLEYMESKLTLTPSNNEHHNKSIYCLAYSSLNSSVIESSLHMLYVKVQVPNITLVYDNTSAAVVSNILIVNGTSITLRCETGLSRPASIILWYKGDTAVQDGVNSRNESYSGLYKVISTFTFIASNADHGMNLYCRGYNIETGNAVTSTTAIINVTVFVSSVTMNPADSSITFLEGDHMIFKCVTSPSRPRPQIRWWVGNETKSDNINESTSKSGNLIRIESEITLMLNRSYRNSLLYCDAQVPGQRTWISSFKSQINVWYPPSFPAVLAYNESFPWLENRTGILECQFSDPGNPAASVTWNSTRGKTDVYSHLILENLTSSDNGSSVKCTLSNNFTLTKGLVFESMTRHLEVEYTPKIELVPNQTSVVVNETRDLLVTCNSRGNPIPSVRWLNISNSSNTLCMKNVSRHDSGTYICMAESRSTNYGRIPLQSRKMLEFTVQFAPEMSVKVAPPIVEVNSEVHIECSVQGEPPDYKFYDWIHKLGKNEVRHFKGILANQSISRISIPNITIADMGTYICSAENGIAGPDGVIFQTMEAQVDVEGVPVTFVRDTTFTGETNMSASIRIPFFSNPQITHLKFFKTWNNTPIANDTDTQVYRTEANISTVFYNTNVVLQGMAAILDFINLKESNFGQYELVLYNNKGNTALSVNLNSSAPPSPVEQFYFYKFVEQYMKFVFVPGFNGGHQQTFTIQFKPSGSLDESWKNTSINGLSEMDERYRLPNGTFLVPVEKPQPGRYVFRMFSVNKKNIRIYSQEVSVYIQEEPNTDTIGLSVAGIAGGIGGGVGVILVIGVIIFLWRRHSYTNKADVDDRELQERERPESGLVENPVYEKSSPRPGKSSSMDGTGAMYATVVKTKNKVPMVEDPNNLYAQVEKTKKRKNKKGEMYENAYLPKKSPNQDDIYESSRPVVKESSENLYEDSGATSANISQVNKSGLLYADLKLDLPTLKNGKYVIHGLDNRTEYAEIAYGKRGNPLPDNNDKEERNGHTK